MRRLLPLLALALAACQPQVPAADNRPPGDTAAKPVVDRPAPPPGTVQAAAMSGQRQRLGFMTSINPDCTSRGEMKVDFTTKPGHGTVDVVQEGDFTNFAPGNPRAQCNGQRVPGTSFYYTSEPGFRGVDAFILNIVAPDGQLRVVPHLIVVQ